MHAKKNHNVETNEMMQRHKQNTTQSVSFEWWHASAHYLIDKEEVGGYHSAVTQKINIKITLKNK